MRVTLLYFSQSGNTEKVAYELAGRLQQAGADVMPLLFEDVADFPEALDDIDILGVGFPVFFGHPPQFVTDMLAGLPPAKEASAFVFATYAGFTAGDSLFDAASALAGKGYRIVGGLKIEAADNYPQGLALKINKGRPTEEDMLPAAEFVEKLMEAHRAGRSLAPEKLAASAGFFAENRGKPRAEVLLRLRREIEGDIAFDRELCLLCATCRKACPSKSIAMDESYPEFSWRCIGGLHCYHCVRVCPGKALTAKAPGSPEDYLRFREKLGETPEEKRRPYVVP